jgi:hypothetical protein
VLYHFLHLGPRTQKQLDFHLFDLAAICHHCLPRIFISTVKGKQYLLMGYRAV